MSLAQEDCDMPNTGNACVDKFIVNKSTMQQIQKKDEFTDLYVEPLIKC